MGPFATVVLSGCLNGLRWLFWFVAGLFVLLVIVQTLRGDADALPRMNLILAGGFLIAGWICGRVARKLLE